jgi:RNA-directed DNA polymerase
MALLKRLYAKLHLRVNESKSAVASAYGRKFLGYSLWAAKGIVVKLRVVDKSAEGLKAAREATDAPYWRQGNG